MKQGSDTLLENLNSAFFFFLQNDLHNEWKSKIEYIQQMP